MLKSGNVHACSNSKLDSHTHAELKITAGQQTISDQLNCVVYMSDHFSEISGQNNMT